METSFLCVNHAILGPLTCQKKLLLCTLGVLNKDGEKQSQEKSGVKLRERERESE
jgi:hypothetical protein